MRFYKSLICLTIVVIPSLFGCNKNQPDSEFDHEWIIYPDGSKEKTSSDMFLFPIKNGKELAILSPEWMSYYYDSSNYMNIVNYYNPGSETSKPRSPIIRWQLEEECSDYTFLLTDNKNMDNPLTFNVNVEACELKNLFAGKRYYYQVKANFLDKIIVSKRKYFKTANFFRTIDIDGVYNARDIGNKVTNNGKKVKQGLVYRTANFDSVTTLGKSQASELGIKTDLDLREQGPTESPLGEDVTYINNGVGEYGSPFYYSITSGVNVELYQPVMRDNLKVFADKNNFPVAFHCAVGRDRTGTLAITLYLLLGVKEKQIKEDYVVSYFSKACNETDIYAYESSMQTLFNFYTTNRGRELNAKGNIYQRVMTYCLDIGLTKEEINSIRDNLLE